jgi:hypothetical protein
MDKIRARTKIGIAESRVKYLSFVFLAEIIGLLCEFG